MARWGALAFAAVLGLPSAAPAQNAAAGAVAFEAQCSACHVVVSSSGETLAGRNGRAGPNLFGLIGRPAGTVPGYAYSPSIIEAGRSGLTWTEAQFVGYMQNPTGYIRDFLGDPRAQQQMAFRVRSDADARDLYAFLVSLGR
ncbi:MAG: c-type cytochrome [Pseudomonadota bacterium]